MKHVIAGLVLLTLVFFYGQYTNRYLEQVIDEISNYMINIQTSFMADDWEAIQTEFDALHEKWEAEKAKLAFIIDHEDANEIDLLIGRIEEEIKMQNEHLLPDTAELIHYGQQIIEKYNLSWGNIF